MKKETNELTLSRRQFMGGALSALALTAIPIKALSQPIRIPELKGRFFDLVIDQHGVNITGKESKAYMVNGSLPAPTLRWQEGERVTLRVKNNLLADTSIHWHGILLPTDMDGVPGLSFVGIKPGEVFEYSFEVKQSGTYWYHSHSGFQEQKGMYGAIIIDSKDPDAYRGDYAYDQEHTLILSDWMDEHPAKVYHTLKKKSHYYNTRERTLPEWFKDVKEQGLKATLNDRHMWNEMRMSDRDISDVTGMVYSFLLNGQSSKTPSQFSFKPGQRTMLRIINAAAMTIYDFRILNRKMGVKMNVIAADGQFIQPVCADEFRIAPAETYDVIVEPEAGSYALYAQTIDRSGYVHGVLSSNGAKQVDVPEMDPAPILDHSDMGMGHHNHGQMDHGSMNHSGMDHRQMDHSKHAGHKMDKQALGKAGMGSTAEISHDNIVLGPHVDMLSEMPQNRVDDPGIGLRDHQRLYGRYVLRYSDLKNRYPTKDKRQPSREIQLHLTGNMSRYMWSINGIKFADAEPLMLDYGERVRITLVNDTMMSHPIHLHGMWSELETGDSDHIPNKHTVIVQPGSKVSYLVTADAKGRWAYHCHLLFHMFGMFREVRVV